MRVVNRHRVKGKHPKGSVYIGRRGPIAWREIARGCADGTALGNPRTDRTEANLDAYRRRLWLMLRGGHQDVLDVFGMLTEESVLVCSCKPGPCHGDVVASAWAWWVDAGRPRRSEEA